MQRSFHLLMLACLLVRAIATDSTTTAPPPQTRTRRSLANSTSDVGAQVAECVLLANSSGLDISCLGGPVMAAIDETALPLARHSSSNLASSGVSWVPSCVTPGCLPTMCGDTKVVIKDSTVATVQSYPGAVQSILCVTNNSQVTVRDSTFADNMLSRAIFGMHHAHIVLHHTLIAGNSVLDDQGAGVRVTDSAHVTISGGSVITGNNAPGGSGAGVFAGSRAEVYIINSSIVNNTCDMFGGGVAAVGNSTVVIAGRSYVYGNIAKDGGGVAALANVSLLVGQDVMFGSNAITDKASFGFDMYASSTQAVQLPTYCGGAATDTPSSLSCITKCSPRVSLRDGACGAGMGWDVKTRGCVCCPEWSFSFEVSYNPGTDTYRPITCKPCPAHALCPGGDVVRPLPGYARSHQRSDQVHKCPLSVEACAGDDQCHIAAGYTGALCTVCAAGYGTTTTLRCGRCMQPQLQFGLYVLLACAVVLFVAFTVHTSWREAMAAALAAASTQAAAPVASLRPSDSIKVLVQFLQYLVIIGSTSVPWPHFMAGMFKASTVIFGASGQALSLDCWLAHYFPTASPPLAIKRQLVVFISPVAVLLAVVGLQLMWAAVQGCVKWMSQCASGHVEPYLTLQYAPSRLLLILDKLPLTALVVMFYAYPSLLRASMGFFACLRIDSASSSSQVQPSSLLLNHEQGYWLGDTQQQCFAQGGWHRAWALGLGLPSLLLLVIGVPAGLLWLLKANASKATNSAFRKHFGFLYSSFRVPERVWWEAVWAVQTIALTVVASFHFQIEAYYSMLLLAVIFCISIAAQQACKPYAVHSLHLMHQVASVCLLFTVFGGLAMFTVDKAADAVRPLHIAVGVLVVTMDAAMVCWCLCATAAALPGCSLQRLAAARLGGGIASKLGSCHKGHQLAAKAVHAPVQRACSRKGVPPARV